MRKLLTLIFGIMLGSSIATAFPNTTQLQEATVKITNMTKDHGGSGTIIGSATSGSLVLTNRHVCALTEEAGGFVITTKGDYLVQKILKSESHDLCLVYVTVNLNIQPVYVASQTPALGDDILISGFPFLMPRQTSQGKLSGNMEVTLITDIVECTEEDFNKHIMLCLGLGGMPIINTYDSMTTNAIIAPGNSGSGVYNDKGELVGLVYAGMGRGLSPGILVPHAYIVQFLSESRRNWIPVAKGRKYSELVKANKKLYRLRNTNVENIFKIEFFPAIKDSKVDDFYNNLVQCKGSRSCLND